MLNQHQWISRNRLGVSSVECIQLIETCNVGEVGRDRSTEGVPVQPPVAMTRNMMKINSDFRAESARANITGNTRNSQNF